MSAQFPDKLAPLFEPARYKVLYGGRGASKSWGIARALLIEGATKPIRVLCAREIQRTIADSVHLLLSDQIEALGLSGHYRILEAEIRGLNGTSFAFAGLRQQDAGKLKSFEGVDRCWVEEAQAVSKKSWDILIPTIRKDGSEIWVSFNPELDSDDTYTRFVVNPPPGTVLINIGWRDNPWFPETLRLEKDHLEKVDPEAYQNVWEGKCRTTVDGAIYHREVTEAVESKRIRPVPYDPMLKVHTVWDLGWNDQMSIILVQRLGSELRIIDYIEDSHRTLVDYVAELQGKRYLWGTDFLPHDGAAKNYQTGKSAQEILQSQGRRVEIVPNTDVETGIKTARIVFPRVFFDETKAQRLLNCLKRYRRVIPTTTNEPGSPLHDEYSHGADAFRYLCLVADRMRNEDKMKPLKYDNRGIV